MAGEVKIALLQSWGGPGPLGQWPAAPPEELARVSFLTDDIAEADYVFVLNDVAQPVRVHCDPSRIWGFIQEPPDGPFRRLNKGRPYFARVFTTDETLTGPRYTPFWGALQWATGLSYDELEAQPFPDKTVDLAWVTSARSFLPGHRKRLRFLNELRREVPELRLHGRGFDPIPRKWDALSPARYAIAFENFGGGIYWSEKLADCFLSYATPIYYGARDIDRYFPPNSYLNFDPDDPQAVDRIRELIASDFHEVHREALLEARELCLTKYNTLVFLAELALADFDRRGPPSNRQWVKMKPGRPNAAGRALARLWARAKRRSRALVGRFGGNR